jgi:hypothetical protein
VFSLGFTFLTLIEVLDLFSFGLMIGLNIDSRTYSVAELIFSSNLMSIDVPFLWVLFCLIICGFLIYSLSLYIYAERIEENDRKSSKYLLINGMFLIAATLVKLEFIFFLSKSTISTMSGSLELLTVLYIRSSTPLIGTLMWLYFSVVVGAFLISGLIIGGIALFWFLQVKDK